ncbi:uncharacterized protein PF11_0213-like isoform X2 [Sitophilus oryzae]|uniref:Uncharacterized protein PF11_0213-like isoform X2 n=1 Tax=Sitophilus oryzae TaxID=7048 RepID=A0A6J2XWB3_SITOR|nr:uncharacterized protein PF11_0213-like isoform X2 [Sitophilus oryzae]
MRKDTSKSQKPDNNNRRPTTTNGNRNPTTRPVPPAPPPPRVTRHHPTPLPATSSIFGSLKRLRAGVATSTKKQQPASNGNAAGGVGVGAAKEVGVARDPTRKAGGKENVEGSKERNGQIGKREEKIGRQGVKSAVVPWDQFVTRRVPRSTTATPSQQSKPKRPVTIAISPNLSRKKGQHKDGQVHSDNLSRTSSVTNLDSLESNYQVQGGKGAKPRKAASKEIIDKAGHDAKRGVTRNNNKLELPVPSGIQPLSYSTDSLQEEELQLLRKQLREMADEKNSLALQLGEQRGQLNVLQKEIQKLKSFQEESNVEMERLAEENTALRNRLRDVAHSPLSDNEKQQLLFESRHHSSAPASIATNVIDDNGGEATTCTTPDWDKHSSSNVSEVSVACLQDKINQMQETHYSTNEELQATLQELTDLQRQLTELQQENERLNEEKSLMFDSLCRQTERLNDSRKEVENLKQVLYRESSDENGVSQFENVVEREERLMEMVKSAQEEREAFLVKLEQVQGELHESRSGIMEKNEDIAQLAERVKTLECTLDAKHAEHKQLDQELTQAKDQCSGKQIEINRLTDLLDNARTKINELEQDRALSDKSELDELLDNARKEKDQLESEVAYLKEQLARSKNEIEKLKEQVFVLQEECKVTRNNAKTTQSDLEYKCEKLISEKNNLSEQLQQFQEAVNELQVHAQCHLEDKRQLSAVLSETQRNLSENERRNLTLENDIEELKKLRAEENDEWEKFQTDLLTSVRVANDFKTEAQQELQKIILENKTYREKVRLLEGQLEKLKGEKASVATQTSIILSPQIVAIARNIDPTLPNRLSLLDRPSSPTENMEKLFPILRRSRSREVLDERISNRSRSRERPDEKAKKSFASIENLAPEEPKKETMGFLKRNKSKENFALDDQHKEGFSFFRRFKSTENLTEPDSTIHKKFDDNNAKTSKSTFKSKSPSSSLESKPKLVKKREKHPVESLKYHAHRKTVSVEEETLLKSLDDWYKNIPENIPEDQLSKEDKAVKKLKQLFEDDMLKSKPMAKKPKEQLAISKPLLNSVFMNPQLMDIIRNPHLPTIETQMIRDSALEEVCSMVNDDFEASPYISRKKNFSSKVDSGLHKSKSVDDLNVFEESRTESELGWVMYRANLPGAKYSAIQRPSYKIMSSDVQPFDSVSNPRYSSKYYDRKSRLQYKPNETQGNDLPKPDIYVNFENLDEIIRDIPKNISESALTDRQKFALKLKQALEEAERKNTLKKLKKSRKSMKQMEISAPTVQSVQKNAKLKEILLNPRYKTIKNEPRSTFFVDINRHSTDISSDIGERAEASELNPTLHSSKSYDNISFSFVPENSLLNMYYSEQARKLKDQTRINSDTSSSFTSAEFNLDTGRINLHHQQHNMTPESTFSEDLLYNDTFAKAKHKEKSKEKQWQSVPNLYRHSSHIGESNFDYEHSNDPKIEEVPNRHEDDLNKKNMEAQMHSNDPKIKEISTKHEDDLKMHMEDQAYCDDPKIKEVSKKYEDDPKMKNIEVHELRRSLRKPKFKIREDVKYQVGNIVAAFDTKECEAQKIENIQANEEKVKDTFSVDFLHEFLEKEKSFSSSELKDLETPIENSTDSNKRISDEESVVKPAKIETHDTITRPDTVDSIHLRRSFQEDVRHFTHLPKKIQNSIENWRLSYRDNHIDKNEQDLNISTHVKEASSSDILPMADITTDHIENDENSKELDVIDLKPSMDNIENVEHVDKEDNSKEIVRTPDDIKTDLTDTVNEIMRDKFHTIDTTDIYKEVVHKDASSEVGVVYAEKVLIQESEPSASHKEESLATDNFDKLTKIVDEKPTKNIDDLFEIIFNSNETNVQDGVTSITQSWSVISGYSEDENYKPSVKIVELENENLHSPPAVSLDNRIEQPAVKGSVEDFDSLPPPLPTSPCPVDVKLSPYDVLKLPEQSKHDEYTVTTIVDSLTTSPSLSKEIHIFAPKVPLPSTDIVDSMLEIAEESVDDSINRADVSSYSTYPYQSEEEEYTGQITSNQPFYNKEDYNSTFKENKYGVVSPLDLRKTYRNLVKEYKNKFNPEETKEENSDASDIEYQEEFIDDFFKPVQTFIDEPNENISQDDEHSDVLMDHQQNEAEISDSILPDEENSDVLIRKAENRMSQIDQDMKDIMEKYLHTRASLLVKESNVKTEENKTNLKKYEKVENLPDIRVENTTTEVVATNKDEPEEILSLEDLSFIAEMREKYASSPPASPTSPVEVRKHNVPTGEGLKEKLQSLTHDELNLISSLKITEESRPVSEINEKDLLMIQEMSKRYSESVSNRTSTESNMDTTIKPSGNEERKSLPPSLLPQAKKYENVVFRNSKVQNKSERQSFPASLQAESRASKRLSDLMFTETLLIPHQNDIESPKSPLSPSYQFKVIPNAKERSQPFTVTSAVSVSSFTSNSQKTSSLNTKDGKLSDSVQRSSVNFKETIFVPEEISRETASPASPNSKNSYKETIFVPNQTESPRNLIQIAKPKPLPARRFKDPPVPPQKFPPKPTSRHTDSAVTKLHNFGPRMKSEENFSENAVKETDLKLEQGPRKDLFEESKHSEKPQLLSEENKIKSVEPELEKTRVMVMEGNSSKGRLEDANLPGATSSKTIVVSTKTEQLDLTNIPPAAGLDDDVEEISRPNSSDASTLNLFKIDSESSCESYLDLFKSKESKDFDTLRGKKHFVSGIAAGFTLMTEDPSDSFTDEKIADFPSMPKVVDFVPIDDNTTPYFTKPETAKNYDTLEREKTFHVLGQAAEISKNTNKEETNNPEDMTKRLKKDDLAESLEVLAKRSSSSHTQIRSSRSSFNQAKKLFEALAEANKDESPRTAAELRNIRSVTRETKSFHQM